ncbi:3'5'-cyclic nucleotide phosphodiesterase family protein [Tritrichomonas foetus]|uniref:Phosphodiesterase n=1 Tax=Tritrichomonas foetus TaxID=1144522 RepID=A0A1J4KAF5_9EUKA|nr:3'5'-cyclic nucleotide phosphodiesterase family protein [Tritrichomonas foetus]|eukprot:OHT07946.1 3'5'-cyclic nucleotide phosphodiesterase family protein [Tritrichomonas foetus]
MRSYKMSQKKRVESMKDLPNPQTPYKRTVKSSIFTQPLNISPQSTSNHSILLEKGSSRRGASPDHLPNLAYDRGSNYPNSQQNLGQSFTPNRSLRNNNITIYGSQLSHTPQSRLSAANLDAMSLSNPAAIRSSRSIVTGNERYLRHESVLEAFLQNSTKMPLHAAIEQTLSFALKGATVTFWQDIPTLHILYSDRTQKTISRSNGLVGYVFFSREMLKLEDASKHFNYDEKVDNEIAPPGTPVLLFPLWDSNNNICAVIEVTRDPKKPFFDEEDEEFTHFFIKKFKIYSPWLFTNTFPHAQCMELLQLMEIEQYLILFTRKIPDLFHCNSCEIWRYDITTKILQQFKRTCQQFDINRAGIAGESIFKEFPINVAANKEQSSYCAESDGETTESVLAVPVIDKKMNKKYCVILRGRKQLNVFTSEDEMKLRDLAPYLVMGLENCEKYSSDDTSGNRNVVEHQCVEYFKKLNDMLSDGISIDEIIKEGIEEIEALTNSDRSFLFTFDKKRSILRSKIATNMKEEVTYPLTDQIIGETYRTGKVFNVSDAYEDLAFDGSFDLQYNYRTKSLASAPIKNNRKEVIGVITLLNKKDGKPFSNTDLSWVHVFGQFCGLLMENESMYETSSESSNQLRSFLNVSLSLSTNKSIKSILNDIMQNARYVVGAERASLFLLDEVVSALTVFLADGGTMPQTIPLSNGIAATSVKTKEPIIVNDAYHDPRFNKMIDYSSGYRTRSVLAVPIITGNGEVLGVTEMINKESDIFTEDDIKLLQSFATFSAMLLETRHLKQITERGRAEIEMNKWIGEFERKSTKTPTKLVLQPEKEAEIFKLNFFAIEYNGIGLFKVAFAVFNAFNLLEKFQISNELFFTFLFKLRESYNEPPYHNWIHAIDVLQYFAYQIHVASFDNVLTGLELLAICIASICHDVGHEGFNNVYNVNAETPLGILFKDQSVLETHHCTLAIHIISQDESNVFHSLQPLELKKIWSWIIQMILATDMAHHFKLVKNANDIMDQGPINLANESHRIMGMTMLMKVADISNVSRPFEIASKWCDVLSEEFWRQGDMELEQGLELSSPLNDRKNNNKPQGQIGFYNFICLPLYQAIARIFPELEVNVEAVKANLEKWKSILAEQQAATAEQQAKTNEETEKEKENSEKS